jgi:tripartite-type tricarboxylate transporter receptor subunit TctC
MKRRHLLSASGATAIAAVLAGAASPALAQAWPARPIRLVVPFPAGGPTDSFARLYAAALAQQLGQSVVVENKAGAGGALGTLEVKRSAPDGYTLLFGTASTHALYNLIQPAAQYDALEDFAYVAVLGGAPVVFVVNISMPRSLKTVAIASKASPGKYNYGSPGSGTLLHVAMERLKQVTGAQITHIPYKGAAPALQDMMGGNIEMTVDTLGSALPQHQAGRVRIVAVASAKRALTAPDIPTVAESAELPQAFEAMLWNVVTAPKGTPEPILRQLADASQKAMSDPALRSKLESQAMFADLHVGQTAAKAFVKAEQAKWKPIIATLGDLSKG